MDPGGRSESFPIHSFGYELKEICVGVRRAFTT